MKLIAAAISVKRDQVSEWKTMMFSNVFKHSPYECWRNTLVLFNAFAIFAFIAPLISESLVLTDQHETSSASHCHLTCYSICQHYLHLKRELCADMTHFFFFFSCPLLNFYICFLILSSCNWKLKASMFSINVTHKLWTIVLISDYARILWNNFALCREFYFS